MHVPNEKTGRRRAARATVVAAGALVLAVPALAAQPSQAASPVRAEAADGTVVHTTDATFDRDVLQSKTPALVSFCAVWSAPCRALEQPLREVARDYAGKLTVASLDIDRNPNTTERFGITAVPTLHVFKNGQITGTRIGPADKSAVVRLLHSNGI